MCKFASHKIMNADQSADPS